MFGRALRGAPDALIGWEQSLFEVTDAAFVATSGKRHHNIVRFTSREEDRIPGVVCARAAVHGDGNRASDAPVLINSRSFAHTTPGMRSSSRPVKRTML